MAKRYAHEIIFIAIGLVTAFFVYVFPLLPLRVVYALNDLPGQYVYRFLKSRPKIPAKIVGVTIDDYSLTNIKYRWPWKRSLYAQAVRNLQNEGVRVIGFDLVFKGESEYPEEDRIFSDSLRESRVPVVLAYTFDYEGLKPVLPASISVGPSVRLGLLDVSADRDSVVRNFRGFLRHKDTVYYSFSVELASAALGLPPAQVVSRIPLFREEMPLIDVYFSAIKFELAPGDTKAITTVSFYDIIENMERLKGENGADFLRDAIVIIYPKAEVLHDMYFTPLGKMPGGFLHLNAVSNILQSRFIRHSGVVSAIFFLLCFAVMFFALRFFDYRVGVPVAVVLCLGVFWSAIVLWNIGITFDFGRTCVFLVFFFVSGSVYRYLHTFVELMSIKDKATRDPLRGVFTIRYFIDRIAMDARRKRSFVICILCDGLHDEAKLVSFETLRELWQQILGVITVRETFWSSCTDDGLIGYGAFPPDKIASELQQVHKGLDELFRKRQMTVEVKIGWSSAADKKITSDLCSRLIEQVAAAQEPVVHISEAGPSDGVSGGVVQRRSQDVLFEGLSEDIEEKNRQLLRLYEDLKSEHGRYREASFQIIASLVNALEARDPYTQGHSERVCMYALRMAERLKWSSGDKEKLRKASLLHDLGKIGIGDAILHKKGALTPEEYDIIKRHSTIAVSILKPLKEFEEIIPWIMYHHEKWDGSGYPHGLGGNAIPLASQIMSLADVYDALATGRDYKLALSRDDALAVIIKNKGTQFNPQLADLFVTVISESVSL